MVETLDERTFFNKLRRTQLQLLARTVGLSYNPSTPATSLSRMIADSGQISEADAKLVLENDHNKREELKIESDKKERLAELEKNRLKNIKAAQPKEITIKADPEPVVKIASPATNINSMSFLELKAYVRDNNIETAANTKVGLIEAIKGTENGEDTITGS